MADISSITLPSGSTYDLKAKTLSHKTLDSTTINNQAGTFAFSGSGDPFPGCDWVGIQVGDSVDKFQIVGNGGRIAFRQNDAGGTNTSWTAWGEPALKSEAITNITRSGTTFTATKADGTTFTFTQQDNNTTYTPANAAPGNIAASGAVGTSTNYARQDHTHGIALATGDSNGQVKIAGTNVAVKGLAALAYKESLGKADVGLGNVDNTSDANKQIYEANLLWGGKNFAGDYGCIDAAMVDELGANRLAFISPSSITVEYSRDGGSTWTDYGASNAAKTALFSQGNSFAIGKADATNKATANGANYQLRITIDTGAAPVYTVLNKFVILVSTNGSNSCTVTIQKALQSTPTAFVDHVANVPLSGWSGYNVINVSGITTYGNQPTTQYGRLRFLFKANGGNTNYTGLNILKIMGFGGVGWMTSSNMAKTGHIYSFDENQNATFPAQVTATQFNGNATTANKLAGFSSGGAATSCTWGNQTGTAIRVSSTPAGGGVFWRDNNPSSGKVSMGVDGTIYINEGNTNVGDAIKTITRSGTTFTYTTLLGATGTFTQQDSNTTYSAGTGLALSGTTFNVAIPRVTKSANSIPGVNKVIFEEYGAGADYNLPSNAWYHIITMEGSDSKYATQLALGMTVHAAYYREYNNQTWGAWASIINTNTWRGIQNVLTSDSTSDSLSAAQGKALANGSARDSTKLPLAGGTMTGDILFSDSGQTTRQIRFLVGANDYARVAAGATASNAGWMEIATADDGNEPIYVRQYTGAYTTLTRTLTLLDASGNTTLPGTLTTKDIYYQGSKSLNRMIRFLDNTGDTTGNGIAIGGGGYTVVGSGEAADTLVAANTSGAGVENLQLGSDNGIEFYSNVQNGVSTAKKMTLDTNGDLKVPRYAYASYLNQSSGAETPTTSSYLMYANSDGFLRKSTLANVKTILGLGSAAYTASTAYAAAGHTHSSVTDSKNSNTITFSYGDSGLGSSTAWLAAWNGYQLRAISPENAIKSYGIATVAETKSYLGIS